MLWVQRALLLVRFYITSKLMGFVSGLLFCCKRSSKQLPQNSRLFDHIYIAQMSHNCIPTTWRLQYTLDNTDITIVIVTPYYQSRYQPSKRIFNHLEPKINLLRAQRSAHVGSTDLLVNHYSPSPTDWLCQCTS